MRHASHARGGRLAASCCVLLPGATGDVVVVVGVSPPASDINRGAGAGADAGSDPDDENIDTPKGVGGIFPLAAGAEEL